MDYIEVNLGIKHVPYSLMLICTLDIPVSRYMNVTKCDSLYIHVKPLSYCYVFFLEYSSENSGGLVFLYRSM